MGWEGGDDGAVLRVQVAVWFVIFVRFSPLTTFSCTRRVPLRLVCRPRSMEAEGVLPCSCHSRGGSLVPYMVATGEFEHFIQTDHDHDDGHALVSTRECFFLSMGSL